LLNSIVKELFGSGFDAEFPKWGRLKAQPTWLTIGGLPSKQVVLWAIPNPTGTQFRCQWVAKKFLIFTRPGDTVLPDD
jgi:hypothetical protein